MASDLAKIPIPKNKHTGGNARILLFACSELHIYIYIYIYICIYMEA